MYPFPRTFPSCPIEALPELLYNAACEVAKLGAGVPAEIMLPDAIAACSAAVHGHYDVVGLDGRSMPMSINTLSLAPSGAGKGTSFAAFFKAFFASGTDQRHADTGEEAEGQPSDSLPLQEVSYRALMEQLNGDNRSSARGRMELPAKRPVLETPKYPDAAQQWWHDSPAQSPQGGSARH